MSDVHDDDARSDDRSGRRPKSLILDVYGRYRRQLGGWLAVSDLVDLMELLGVDEQAVRSAVSRMSRRGLLTKETRGRVRGYSVTPQATAMFAEADERIYAPMDPAPLDEGWVLVSFSMPEGERDKRYALRSRLTWLGMGMARSGLRIAPRRVMPEVVRAVDELGLGAYVEIFTARYEGPGDLQELVDEAWDLDSLAASYQAFVDAHATVLTQLRRRRSPVEPAEAFATYTLALHEWRKFPYLDPGLPAELLPRGWPGGPAAAVFAELRERLEPLAFEYATAVADRVATAAG